MVGNPLTDKLSEAELDEVERCMTGRRAGDDTQRVTAHEGCKQVMLDGHHLADCATPEAAAIIAICLNRAGAQHWPLEEKRRVMDFFA